MKKEISNFIITSNNNIEYFDDIKNMWNEIEILDKQLLQVLLKIVYFYIKIQ